MDTTTTAPVQVTYDSAEKANARALRDLLARELHRRGADSDPTLIAKLAWRMRGTVDEPTIIVRQGADPVAFKAGLDSLLDPASPDTVIAAPPVANPADELHRRRQALTPRWLGMPRAARSLYVAAAHAVDESERRLLLTVARALEGRAADATVIPVEVMDLIDDERKA